MKRSWLLNLVALVAALSCPSWARGQTLYRVVDLGVLPGGGISMGMGINATGVVAGIGQNSGGQDRAIRADAGSSPTDLSTLIGGRFSSGVALNDLGVVVGSSEVMTAPFQWAVHAFRSTGPGDLVDLGVLENGIDSYATGINASGLIVGYGQVTSPNGPLTRAFQTAGGARPSEVGLLPGGRNSRAEGVNAAGQIVGSADNASGDYRAFRTTGGGVLQDLGGLAGGTGSSYGLAINRLGVVVGKAGIVGGSQAFRTRSDDTLEPLGFLPGTTSSVARGINDSGTVVGSASFRSGASRAFVYNDRDGLSDLNARIPINTGWVLNAANGINNFDQIVGTGTLNGQLHAFRLDPQITSIPEPSVLTLAGIGLGLAAAAVWVRRRPTTTL